MPALPGSMHMLYVHLIVGLRAGEMVVSDVKCLLKKHGNLSLILRTHKKKKVKDGG